MHKYLLLLTFAIFSCSETRKNLKSEFLPNARGEADEIILVIDSAQWADTLGLGKEVKKTFLSPILGLPQDEPMFSVSKVNPKKLNSTLKAAKNMVFITTLDSRTSESRTIQNYFTSQALNQIKRDSTQFMRIRKDEFARGQNVMFLFAATEEKLAKQIQYNRSQIQEFFEESARKSIQAKLFKSPKKELAKQLREDLGVELVIPFGWERAKNLKNFVWFRKMDAETEQSLFIYFEPYRDRNMFNDIGSFRDKITSTFLRDSEKPSKFIQRQEIINVFTERINFNGNFALEARSLWKISDNSRGGPFLSYTIVDETNGMVYYVEGYVDSPGTKKKNLIRELEAILGTFKTPGDLAKKIR
ncbi:MAG: DUF4837 family protein [Cyclobacteriaceae bacterium]